MCVACPDCEQHPYKHDRFYCDGFKGFETKKTVIDNGRFTKNYRWCSHWDEEKIRQKEIEYLKR